MLNHTRRPRKLAQGATVAFSIALSTCLLSGIASAQTNLNYGVRGGINLSTMSGDTYSDLGYRPGLVLGGYVTMPRTDKWSLQAELVYSQEGARNANYDFSSFSTVVYDQKLKYDYLNIPVLARYQVADKVDVQGGPQIGIRLSAKESRKIKSGEPAPSDNSAGTRKFSDRIKLIYPSITAGAGYAISDKAQATARLYYSPFDNVKSNAGDSEGTYPFTFQIAMSYALGTHVLNR